MSEVDGVKVRDVNEVDEASCARAAALAAYGFGDRQIADTLVLTIEQVEWARNSEVFRKAYADKALERAQAAIDLSEGWDSVESNAVATVLEALQWNKDPKFALLAARSANAAKRTVMPTARTIDPSRAGTVVHISMNNRFVQQIQARHNEGNETAPQEPLDITPRQALPQRQVTRIVDMPSPKQVKDLLTPVEPLLHKMRETNISDLMEEMHFGDISKDG